MNDLIRRRPVGASWVEITAVAAAPLPPPPLNVTDGAVKYPDPAYVTVTD